LSDTAVRNLISRGRHLGPHCIFVTNMPQALPPLIHRQIDNLWVTRLSHHDDIRALAQTAFVDEALLGRLVTRLPERRALVVGRLTNFCPLVVEVDPLPDDVPQSGQTRSAWDRLVVPVGTT
jgi:hypothetical protein